MNKSESINELAAALAKAQGKLKNPPFDSNNPHFRSKYASLASVRDTVIPILSEHGLSIVQMPIFEDGKAGCETMLMHSSGQYISERLLIPVDKPNAHGVGSATTYSRRFSLMAFAGVVGDEDDDGNASVGKNASTSKAIVPAPISPTTGCWDDVPKERHEALHRIADSIVDMFAEGSLEDAYEYIYVENVDNGKITSEEFICVWDDLKAHSKIRSTLTKMRNERKAKKEAA